RTPGGASAAADPPPTSSARALESVKRRSRALVKVFVSADHLNRGLTPCGREPCNTRAIAAPPGCGRSRGTAAVPGTSPLPRPRWGRRDGVRARRARDAPPRRRCRGVLAADELEAGLADELLVLVTKREDDRGTTTTLPAHRH